MPETRLMPDEYYDEVRREAWVAYGVISGILVVAAVGIAIHDVGYSLWVVAVILLVTGGFVRLSRLWRKPVYVTSDGIDFYKSRSAGWRHIPREKIRELELVEHHCTPQTRHSAYDASPRYVGMQVSGGDGLMETTYADLATRGLNRAAGVLDVPVRTNRIYDTDCNDG